MDLALLLIGIATTAGIGVTIGVIAWTAKAQIGRIAKLEADHAELKIANAAITEKLDGQGDNVKRIDTNMSTLIAHLLPPAPDRPPPDSPPALLE